MWAVKQPKDSIFSRRGWSAEGVEASLILDRQVLGFGPCSDPQSEENATRREGPTEEDAPQKRKAEIESDKIEHVPRSTLCV